MPLMSYPRKRVFRKLQIWIPDQVGNDGFNKSNFRVNDKAAVNFSNATRIHRIKTSYSQLFN